MLHLTSDSQKVRVSAVHLTFGRMKICRLKIFNYLKDNMQFLLHFLKFRQIWSLKMQSLLKINALQIAKNAIKTKQKSVRCVDEWEKNVSAENCVGFAHFCSKKIGGNSFQSH